MLAFIQFDHNLSRGNRRSESGNQNFLSPVLKSDRSGPDRMTVTQKHMVFLKRRHRFSVNSGSAKTVALFFVLSLSLSGWDVCGQSTRSSSLIRFSLGVAPHFGPHFPKLSRTLHSRCHPDSGCGCCFRDVEPLLRWRKSSLDHRQLKD